MDAVSEGMRDEAAKCRELAGNLKDQFAIAALNDLAVDLEKRAAQAEAIRSPQGPQPSSGGRR